MLLPDPQDDELFYSVVARFADRMGLSIPSAVAKLTFGLDRITPTMEIPPRLDVLLPRLLPHSPYTADTLVSRHSLVPYYTAFLDEDRASPARDAILHADPIRAFARLGINSLRNPLALRFCPACAHGDRRAGLEPHWRRSHNLPGVVLCHRHGDPLHEGPPVRGDEWAGFVSVTRVIEDGGPTRPVTATAAASTLEQVAAASVALLQRREPLTGGDLAPAFFERLRTAGWTHGQRIASTKLMAAVRRRLGDDVLAEIGVTHHRFTSATDDRHRHRSTDWLAQCLRVRGSVSHPLPYILILIALDIDVRELIAAAADGDPPAAGEDILDGPCGNAVCPRFDPPTPRPLDRPPGGGMLMVCCPECGFAYRQSAGADLPRQYRIAAFGELWDAALRNECETGDATKLVIEERLGLNIYTIKRRALELGVWHPRWGAQTRDRTRQLKEREWIAKREASRRDYRERWRQLVADAPGMGRREIGRSDETTYSFLRTYDHEWLDEATPLVPRPQGGGVRIDPGDEALAALIVEAAEDIRASLPPRRVTRAAIARSLGRTLLQPDASRLPRSAAALAQVAETAAAFGARRRAGRNPGGDGASGWAGAGWRSPDEMGGDPP